MDKMMVGAGPILWGRGISFPDKLREIARAGYDGCEVSEYINRPDDLRELLAETGLVTSSTYLSVELHNPASQAEELETAVRQARTLRSLGADCLVVAGRCFEERFAVAGHVTTGRTDGMSAEQWGRFTEQLNEMGRRCLDEGVRVVYHNHAGSYIETGEEMDRLMENTDPDAVFLCPDTGHMLYGGADPVECCRKYASRIKYVHLKDVDCGVLDVTRRELKPYRWMGAAGGWTELGRGCINFQEIMNALTTAGFVGWLVNEQDTTQRDPTESAVISRCYIRDVLGY